jgi:hypothetical protein
MGEAHLVQRLKHVTLTDQDDVFNWKLTMNGDIYNEISVS